MHWLILCLDIIGTVSFAISGALCGVKANMDVFGTCVLGLTTATGGGMIRDVMLGITPPSVFSQPEHFIIAVCVSILVFLPLVRRTLNAVPGLYDKAMLLTDSAGLGIFTVYGVSVAMSHGFGNNISLVLFVGVITGVGGGIFRDLFSGSRPYIFVKHIYAVAALGGALVCRLLWYRLGSSWSMLAGCAFIFVLRICSAVFRWNLPKAKDI